ncbi:pilus assembly protein TadG-related protein [Methylocystis echinoides]|uniref:TadE/TadG family type IV pilus assembly protein n=1 Tax=Methylocystis echinoides TaxID=29468 RepID=UPI003415F597
MLFGQFKRGAAARLSAFGRDNRGVVAVIFGLTLAPALFLAGAAIDYGSALRVKGNLKSAADAAVLQAARGFLSAADGVDWYSYNLYLKNSQYSKWQEIDIKQQTAKALTDVAISQANAKAQAIFKAGVDPKIRDAKLDITTTVNDAAVVSRGVYSGAVDASLTKVLGFKTLPISGTVEATAGIQYTQNYKNIYFLVDVSQSMSVGGAQADRDRLALYTPGGCVFACHDVRDGDETLPVQIPGYLTRKNGRLTTANVAVAGALGIQTRLDYIRNAMLAFVSAVDQKVSQMKTAAADAARNNATQAGLSQSKINSAVNDAIKDWNNVYRFSISTMYKDSLDYTGRTDNYPNVIDRIKDKIVLGDAEDNETGQSNMGDVLGKLAYKLNGSGDAEAKGTAQDYVIIITDGVVHYTQPHDGNDIVKAVGYDSLTCTGFKKDGTRRRPGDPVVIVIYTPYIKFMPGYSTYYDTSVKPHQEPTDWYGKALQDYCASSPEWFFEASEGPAITDALNKVYSRIMMPSVGLTK